VKLVDIPEMSYLGSDAPHPRGEVCVRGPSLFAGYYKDPAQTAEVLGPDGWLHTGDVGEWLPGGRLRIIDRKKNIFKLAQGEYIAPEKIEGVYGRCPLVAQAFVYGDSLRAELVALVVPDPDTVLPWARERGLVPPGASPEEAVAKVCASPAAAAAVHAAMVAEGRAAKLRGFEQVAAITLTPDAFSVDNGLLTPTFKVKRAAAEKAFAGAIAAMYARLKE
jgi:long-chain acyl-CoA synthetase